MEVTMQFWHLVSKLIKSGFKITSYLFMITFLFADCGFADDVTGSLQIKHQIFKYYDGSESCNDAGFFQKSSQYCELTKHRTDDGHFSFSFSGELVENNYNSKIDSEEYSRAFSIDDTFSDNIHGYVYQLSLEFYDYGPFETLFLGRQYVSRDFISHIDGLYTNITILDNLMNIYLFGGFPVRFYDDSEYPDSKVAGTGLKLSLPTQTQVSAGYIFCEEKDSAYGNDYSDSYHEEALTINQRIFGISELLLKMTVLESEIKSLKFSASSWFEKIDPNLTFDLSYYRQLIEVDQTPSMFSVFTRLLGPVKPYQSVYLQFSKSILDRGILFGGLEWRDLLSGESESEFNHSFLHEYLAVSFFPFFAEALELTLQGNRWQRLDDDKKIISGEGELKFKASEQIKLRGGISYSLFKYDYYYDFNETTDVYSIFFEGRYDIFRDYFIGGKYCMDIYDIREHRITLTAGYNF